MNPRQRAALAELSCARRILGERERAFEDRPSNATHDELTEAADAVDDAIAIAQEFGVPTFPVARRAA